MYICFCVYARHADFVREVPKDSERVFMYLLLFIEMLFFVLRWSIWDDILESWGALTNFDCYVIFMLRIVCNKQYYDILFSWLSRNSTKPHRPTNTIKSSNLLVCFQLKNLCSSWSNFHTSYLDWRIAVVQYRYILLQCCIHMCDLVVWNRFRSYMTMQCFKIPSYVILYATI